MYSSASSNGLLGSQVHCISPADIQHQYPPHRQLHPSVSVPIHTQHQHTYTHTLTHTHAHRMATTRDTNTNTNININTNTNANANAMTIMPSNTNTQTRIMRGGEKEMSGDGKRSVRRRRSATGTRKHITLDALIALDAPIQPRKYLGPSATSRRDAFPNTRTSSGSGGGGGDGIGGGEGDEEDELVDDGEGEGDSASASSMAEHQRQMEWKRMQNTLAARKSRQRKLMYQLELKEAVGRLSGERDTWKARAQMYEALLRSNGIRVPEV